MNYLIPFYEHLAYFVTSIETQLIIATIFPALAIGIAIKYMRSLAKHD